MKSKTIRFLSFLFPCLLACSQTWAQPGPQDNLVRTVHSMALPNWVATHDLIVTAQRDMLLLTDTENDKIESCDINGSLIRSFGSIKARRMANFDPVELAIGPNNRIYVTD